MTAEKTRLRVILPGGGVKGAFQLGALTAILGTGRYTIDAVYGCSIGAILAPLVSVENVAKITTLFNGIRDVSDVLQRRTWLCGLVEYPEWTVVQGLSSFLQLGAYQSVKLVDTMLQSLTQEELALAQSRCHVVAYDLLNNQERWFTGSELAVGVRCSSALWLAVPPISYGGTLYSDGGATEVFPVTYILEHELSGPAFDGVYVFIDCDARTPYTTPAPTDGLSLMSALQWAAASRLAEFELQRLKRELLSPLEIIRPASNLLNSALDIDPARMKATFDAGAAAGLHVITTRECRLAVA